MIHPFRQLPLLACAVLALSASARAQDAATAEPPEGLFPPQAAANAPEYDFSPGMDTHPVIRLTPEKSEIISLDTDIKSLIVGNPLHLNVIMDTTKRLVLVPRSPGATSFTALDENGKVIMQRHVIVNGPDEKYVRVRRSCSAAATSGLGAVNCQDMSMYYCPDGLCHPVNVITSNTYVPTSGNRAIAPSAGGGSGSGGMGQSDMGAFNENFNENEGPNPFQLLMDALRDAGQATSGEAE